MKKILSTVFVLLAVMASGVSKAHADATKSASSSLNILFVQNAKSGAISPIAGKPGYYTLRLQDVGEYLGYFSDRPARVSGLVTTAYFTKRWENSTQTGSFKQVPPNAALNATTDHLLKKTVVNYMIELTDPVYDVKTQRMEYTIRFLKGSKSGLAKTVRLENIALFIDDYCASCVGRQF